jgi:hypothetical protein
MRQQLSKTRLTLDEMKPAMGWARGMAAGHPLVWHDGLTFGYSAFNGLFLDDGFSVSILTNVALSDGSATTVLQSR